MSASSTTRSREDVNLSINLSSNNPFRRGAPSPSLIDDGPVSPFDDPSPAARPVSRNPFLDQSQQQPIKSPGAMSSHSDHQSLSAEDIFASLTLDDKSTSAAKDANKPSGPPPPRPMNRQPGPRRDENIPPSGGRGSSNHRPTRSQEDAMRMRRPGPGPGPGPGPRPGPPNSRGPPQRRPRRNSESSVIDLDSKPLTAEERKMIEEKRREQERKRRDARPRTDAKDKPRSSRPSRRLDIIDQLDATSIYGTGLFHHDGPFDALNPHRNRQNSRRAPMQAFPKDSLNNSLGGFGPVSKQADHSTFLGNATEEAFRDYSGNKGAVASTGLPATEARDPRSPVLIDPVARGSVVHGDESHGLGTSTFLEGTPATRTAIARHREEQAQVAVETGMQRKKSLAHRIRNINKVPRDFNASGRMTNPEAAYARRSPSALSPGSNPETENNPFLVEFSKGEDSISVRPRDGPTSPMETLSRARSNHGLERRSTTEATTTMEDAPAPAAKPTGIIGRMKSLKGPRKPRQASTSNVEAPASSGAAV